MDTHTCVQLVTAKSSQKDPESTEEQQPQQLVEKEEEKASSSAEPTVSSGAAVSACVSDVEEALKEAGVCGDSLS